MSPTCTLAEAYDIVLGGVMAISPEIYKSALKTIAGLCNRVCDEQFMKEVKSHEKTLACDLD